jgi:ABC-type multidrug transport system fused ATPase/permease subunit
VGVAVATSAGAVATIDPLLMRQLIDGALPRHSILETALDVVLITLCFVFRAVLGGVSSLVSFRVTQRLAQDLRTELLVHMTALAPDWHERTLLGQKVSRIEQDVDQIAQYGSEVGNTVFRAAIFFIVNLTIMAVLNWRMAAAILPLLPLFFWVRLRFRGLIQSRADQAQAEVGNAAAQLTEHLGAVPQIQLLGAEQVRVSLTVESWLNALTAQWKQRRTEVAFSVSITSVLAVGILLVLGLGAHEYFIGTLSIGGLVAFYAYVTRVFEPVSAAMELYARTQRMLASARRVREVLDEESSVPDRGVIGTIPHPLEIGLACKDISFGYEPRTVILRNISLSLRSGERIAVVGKSGSGKSTLSRLLARLADPLEGQIMLEGKPLPDFALRELRRAISYVPQQPVLFSGSFRNNLLGGNPDVDEEEIQRVIEATQLKAVLKRLPLGTDAVLGPEAAGISGGERQRLSVARALLRRPSILILDESTSALDLPTEAALFRAVASLRADMSMIVISHRLRSLTWLDRIVVLNGGEVVAEGSHLELHRSCAYYRDLYEREEEIGGLHPNGPFDDELSSCGTRLQA